MGACDFYESSRETDPKKAFRSLVDNAQYEYGSGGYSGTIAEKSDFTILTRTPQSPEELNALHAKYADGDKWGPAYAAPFAAVESGKEKVVKVRAKNQTEAEQKLREKFKGKSFKVKEIKAITSPHTNKIRRKKHGGKPKIKWAWSSNGKTYDKPLDAARAAEEYLKERAGKGDAGWVIDTAYTVFPVAVLIDNDGTVTKHSKTPVAYTVTLGRNDKVVTWEATVVMRKVSKKIAGWSFWGWASS
jgi:hypothetical protein